ncbi:50S ribosomal protein L24 [uncultured archaeon]|nr:50S ribosomal protein L24 [uncultured archaeon]
MKNKFSKHWKASTQPRKQRKYAANAPMHLKRKMLSVNLSKELRKKFSKRNIVVRKGDSVKVMRGKFKNKTGKITEVFTKISKVIIEGITVKKQDGSKANIKMRPSNLQIIELNLDDKKRMRETSTHSPDKQSNERMKQNKTESKETKKVEEKK